MRLLTAGVSHPLAGRAGTSPARPNRSPPWHAESVFTVALTAGVLALVGYRLATSAHAAVRSAELRRRAVAIVAGIRWRHVWPVPFVLTAVAVTAFALVQLPVLRLGWWSALGGVGNPVVGSTEQTTGTTLEWLVPLVFVLLLLPALPLFAYREEEMFRQGAETWSPARRIERAVRFGLVHAIVGIPIGVALALSLGGGYFQWHYLRGYRATGDRRQGLLESARAHTAYNGLIVALVLALIAAGGLS
jgi:hypothetical protein